MPDLSRIADTCRHDPLTRAAAYSTSEVALVFLTVVAAIAFDLPQTIDQRQRLALVALVLFVLMTIMFLVFGILLFRRAAAPHECSNCRYDLSRTSSDVCPECGKAKSTASTDEADE